MTNRSRFPFRFTIFSVLVFILLSCGGGGNSSDNSASQLSDQSNDRCSGLSLDAMIKDLEFNRPSWAELDCFTAGLSRSSYPRFTKRILASSEKFGMTSNQLPRHLSYWDSLTTTYPDSNISPAMTASIPPYADNQGVTLDYPLTPDWRDEMLRASAAVFIREKQQGRRLWLQLMYPPGYIDLGFTTESEFLQWVQTDFTEEVKAYAKMAEKVKAEYLYPYPIEIEVFINNQSGFVDSLTGAEKTALAQEVIDQALTAARSVFKGRIEAFSYFNYYLNPTETYWKNIDYSRYDGITFSVFPTCDLATSTAYMDAQLSNYLDIINTNGLPWELGEITIQENYFSACNITGDAFLALKDDLLQMVFNKLDQMTPHPVGVHIGADTQADEPSKFVNVINTYLQAH